MTSKRLANTFIRRVTRTRNKLKKDKLRLSIFKSNKSLSVQVIDFDKNITTYSISTLSKNRPEEIKPYTVQAAEWLGQEFGKKFTGQQFIFDKGGYRYTGKIKIFADAARQQGVRI